MINLVFDILLTIFDLLAQEDKLECMTVCQQWYDIIYTHSLFRDIYIYNNEQLDLLMARVKRDPVLGEKVEKFLLVFPLYSDFYDKMFIELFPNLRCYAWCGFPVYRDSFIRFEPGQKHPWCRHIEQIKEMETNLRILLISGVCKNLTFISMKGDSLISNHDFIKLLTNAPSLKILDIRNFSMSLQDLELLHNVVPRLDSLWMTRVLFETTSSPRGITSATSVKSLRCSDLSFFVDFKSSVFFSFISQKYTHVEELTLHHFCNVSRRNIIATTSYMKTLRSKLKSFSFIFDWEKLEVGDMFDFYTMYTGGCQIEKLELGDHVKTSTLEHLVENTQAQYVRSLTISGIAYIQAVESFLFSFSWLLRFTSLKELQLSSAPNDTVIVDLNDMLENLSETRLERLRLQGVHLQLKESSIIPVYPSLRNLALEYATYDKGIDAFISGAFPNLKRLSLKFRRGLKGSIMFPSLDLSYLEMINWTNEDTFPVMLITLDDGQKRLYNARTKYIPIKNLISFPPAYCQSYDKSDIIPMLTITCHSVYDFNLFVYKTRPRT